MTARQMFEETGYEVGFDYYGRFLYAIAKGTKQINITFDLKNKEYTVRINRYATNVNAELHKLITYQLKELGWL